MNRKLVFKNLGRLISSLGVLLLLPIITAICYREWRCLAIFAGIAAVSVLAGTLMHRCIKPKDNVLYAKEGFAITALAWVVLSVIGALPFTLSGEIPNYIDALFETVSGFTTTGASIVTDVEAMSRSMLMWRSFTHWVGGMGVLVFMTALLPNLSDRSVHILKAEMPGPIFGKILPRSKDTAKILYIIYMAMTFVLILLLMAGGMSLYESIIHAVGAAGTGGFGIYSDSIAGYSPYIQWVLTVFMLLFAVNFNLYFYFIMKRSLAAFKSTELYVFGGIVAVSTAAICANIFSLFGSFSEALRHAAFQVASIISTTGYATQNFDAWPGFSRTLLVLLMFIGGCAGSTAGGLKVARIVLIFKTIGAEFRRLIHPRAVTAIRLEGKNVDKATAIGVPVYISVYFACYAITLLLLSLEPFDFTTNFTAVAACINNIGPGLGEVGPNGSFSIYSNLSTLLLAFTMLLGRLEIFPLLLTCMPGTWRRD